MTDQVAGLPDLKYITSARLADIAATDRLIDQIVYQLYGLTEEKIAVVEPLNH